MVSEYGTENTTFRINKNSHGKSRASHDFCGNAKTRASKAGPNSIYTEPLGAKGMDLPINEVT